MLGKETELSLKKIFGDSKKLLVFGLNYKHNDQLRYLLINLGYKTYGYSAIPFSRIKYFNDDFSNKGLKRECKNTITSLIFENYKRIKENKPIIPMLFCLEYEEDGKKITVDLEQAATSQSSLGNFSDSEIRRIYKILSEMNSELVDIAINTFKFVKQVKSSENCFTFEEMNPFLDHKWIQGWSKRESRKQNNSFFSKKCYWKDELNNEISSYSLRTVQ